MKQEKNNVKTIQWPICELDIRSRSHVSYIYSFGANTLIFTSLTESKFWQSYREMSSSRSSSIVACSHFLQRFYWQLPSYAYHILLLTLKNLKEHWTFFVFQWKITKNHWCKKKANRSWKLFNAIRCLGVTRLLYWCVWRKQLCPLFT